ncbi:MAG: acyl-CoA thioesterase [Rhodoferax sp.]|nr:acyl-CoA thioesterase [Rhodoferax sp.]
MDLPILAGELVTVLASVNHTGTSSMEIGIKVIAENIQNPVVRHVNSCFFTLVAVDDERRPALVAPRWHLLCLARFAATRPPSCARTCAGRWSSALPRHAALHSSSPS